MKILITLTQIAMVIMCSVTAGAAKLLVDINMQWKPTTALTEFKKLDYNDISTLKIELKDARKVAPSTRIGERSEDPKEFLPVETKDSISEFVNKNLSDTLSKIGLNTTTENAEYVLTGEIKEFYVTETNRYNGVLKINFVLKKAGQTVWESKLFVENSRFGRSYKYDNYMETFSDCIVDMSGNLLANDGFKKAFQTKKGKN